MERWKLHPSAPGCRLENLGGAARLDLTSSGIVRAVHLKGSLDLKGSGSDIDLEHVAGNVTINGAYVGNVEFLDLGGPDAHVTGPQTEFSAEKVPGDVRMPLRNFNASNLVGPVHVQTRLRDVQISDFTNALDVSVDNGDIELRPASPLARMDVHTRSGNITLALPKDAKFAFTASTGVGSKFVNEFGSPLLLEEARRSATICTGPTAGPSVDGARGTGSDHGCARLPRRNRPLNRAWAQDPTPRNLRGRGG